MEKGQVPKPMGPFLLLINRQGQGTPVFEPFRIRVKTLNFGAVKAVNYWQLILRSGNTLAVQRPYNDDG